MTDTTTQMDMWQKMTEIVESHDRLGVENAHGTSSQTRTSAATLRKFLTKPTSERLFRLCRMTELQHCFALSEATRRVTDP